MKIEICKDDGLTIVCQKVKRLETVSNSTGKVKLYINKKDFIEIDKSNYRIHIQKRLWLFKKKILRYYVGEIPVEKMSVEDYKRLKQLQIEMETLSKNALSKSLQTYMMLMVIVIVVALGVVAWVSSRPLNVEVIVPSINQTATTTVPPVVPPP